MAEAINPLGNIIDKGSGDENDGSGVRSPTHDIENILDAERRHTHDPQSGQVRCDEYVDNVQPDVPIDRPQMSLSTIAGRGAQDVNASNKDACNARNGTIVSRMSSLSWEQYSSVQSGRDEAGSCVVTTPVSGGGGFPSTTRRSVGVSIEFAGGSAEGTRNYPFGQLRKKMSASPLTASAAAWTAALESPSPAASTDRGGTTGNNVSTWDKRGTTISRPVPLPLRTLPPPQPQLPQSQPLPLSPPLLPPPPPQAPHTGGATGAGGSSAPASSGGGTGLRDLEGCVVWYNDDSAAEADIESMASVASVDSREVRTH